jgi:glycine hydroxymethyltransferase
LTEKGVTGKQAERALDKAGVTVNANTIPFDARKPWDPSGVRLGTPVLTTRGMRESEMRAVGEIIAKGIENWQDEAVLAKLRDETRELCKRFPIEKGL